MLSQDDFASAYGYLSNARMELDAAMHDNTATANALAWAKWAAIAAGEIAGKNETEREAHARMMLRPLYQDLEATERRLRAAQTDYELRELRVQMLGRQLRVWELTLWSGQVRPDVDGAFETR